MKSPSPTDLSDLQWLAFRYVGDELTAEERGAFESRLADDVAACEALAEVVLLVEGVAAAETVVPVTVVPLRKAGAVTTPLRRNWLPVGFAAAAALLAAAWMTGRLPLGSRDVASLPVVVSESGPSRSVLSLWVSLRDDEPASNDAAWVDNSHDEPVVDAVSDVPDWMFAALATSTNVSDMNSLLPEEPL